MADRKDSGRREGVTRRKFMNATGGAAAAAALASTLPVGPSVEAAQSARSDTPGDPSALRARLAHEMRVKVSKWEYDQPRLQQKTNGDEERYEKKWASYSKGLPHNQRGEVDPAAWRVFREAIASGHPEALEQIPLGGYLKLANPHAALAFDLIGPDSHQLTINPPPTFESEDLAGEMAELYWKALLRDVPFAEYETNELAKRASAELSSFGAFCGPRSDKRVTTLTVCRGPSMGGLVGPYVSQFLLRDIPFSPIRVPQKIRTAIPNKDYLTSPAEWLAVQNGGLAGVNTFDDKARYIRNGRDLGEYVHRDFSYQAFLAATLILLKNSAPLDGSIPYQYSVNQGGFVTFGAPDILHFVASVANSSLKATWYQKWIVHRTARPEEMGGRLHFETPMHPALRDSEAVDRVVKKYGSALLPVAYPEGCPAHPSYPAGHAVIAGACATVIKAWFAESWVLPKSFVPSADGLSLDSWKGADLTLGNEIDKLAENIAYGRNFAGLHTRSDAHEGLLLGEAFAINYLREMRLTTREFFNGFNVTKLDGTRITV